MESLGSSPRADVPISAPNSRARQAGLHMVSLPGRSRRAAIPWPANAAPRIVRPAHPEVKPIRPRDQLDVPPQSAEEVTSRKRKLAAILHADVLRGAVDPLIAAQGGRIVGTA